ncbi:PIN domain-containing protein [Sphaerisporangium album]|uniref:PIN domain-containing protein n=1 Tax=Sphaerisporangium album TaxID=509200 RepID=A0A367FJ88_9ACTN|nr:PIN domain-containing protein [Sphaerisporangium album]RCG30446.1 PIN domain-containing protein [Sphaerisporangium album]
MIVVADTSGIIAASDRNAVEAPVCRDVLRNAGTVIVSPLVLAEVDHMAKVRFGVAARAVIIAFILEQVRRMRFLVPQTTAEVLDTAQAVQRRYAGLDLDLADAVNVALAADYRTDAVLTLDRRDFRAVRPLTPHKAFRLLPDDL